MTDTTSTGSPTFRWGSVPTHLFCALWGKQGVGQISVKRSTGGLTGW